MNKELYLSQVELLLDCLPALREQEIFALKGGTAINFFIRDLPRLSVDIDLTYVKTEPWIEATSKIEDGLKELGRAIVKRNKKLQILELRADGTLHKIMVVNGSTRIKIEPNFVMRGTLLPTRKVDITKAIEEKFEYSVKQIPLLADDELYAGKICAALSRQHPRDFFDVQKLLETSGITDAIRSAFVVYLMCSPRPIHELLQPNRISLDRLYENEFANMTENPISLESLLITREVLIEKINKSLVDREREFILSVKNGEPDYSLMPFKNLEKFPALNWKLMNIQKMDRKKHLGMLQKLTVVLER